MVEGTIGCGRLLMGTGKSGRLDATAFAISLLLFPVRIPSSIPRTRVLQLGLVPPPSFRASGKQPSSRGGLCVRPGREGCRGERLAPVSRRKSVWMEGGAAPERL